MITCPRCGARNPEGAEWCSQCYLDLRPAPAEPEPAQEAAQEAAPDAAAGAGGGPGGLDDGEEVTARGGRFRRQGEEIEWRCVVCETWNPVGITNCTVCGTPFGRTIGVADQDAPPLNDVDEGTVLIASAILPGLGHILLGRRGMGAVRAVTYLLWLIGGWLLLRAAAQADQSVLPAVPLLLGAFLLWVTSCYDGVMLAGDRGREILTPRAFFWLVVGVVGLLIVGFVPGILRAGTAQDAGGDGDVQVVDDEGDDVDADLPAPVQTVTVTAPPAGGTTTTAPPQPGLPATSPAPVPSPS